MKRLLYLLYCVFAALLVGCSSNVEDSTKKKDKEDSSEKVMTGSAMGSFVAKPFSVSAFKTVTFSPGNLQYHAANDEWRFAPNQTDYIGEANENISSTYNGWIDLFGWGTGNNPTNKSTDNDDYQTFIDWGVNKIGNDAPNTWRTLTEYEWDYILNNRTNASNLKGVAQVDGVNGLVLLPDAWQCPSGVTFKSGFHSSYSEEYATYQSFSASEWSKLESSGAVFLPAAGGRYSSPGYVQGDGNYWSAREGYYSYDAFTLPFCSGAANLVVNGRACGHSVRLVQEEPSEPSMGSFVAKPFSVAADKTVTFSPGNLQYHAASKEWGFAPNQTDYIGEANENISSTYNDWIDLFGWGTGNNPTNKSTGDYDYPTFVDWGINKIGNDAPNTWRTLTYDEWDYVFNNRTNASNLKGVAQVDGVNGLILLPDAWQCPSGVAFESGFCSSYGKEYSTYQSFSASEWSKLEASGAVFLPAAGGRYGSDVSYVQFSGDYWSATEEYSYEDYSFYAYDLSFYSNVADRGNYNRYDGLSVRLVQD